MILNIIFIVLAYLTGSVSSAIIICKISGLPDPRTQGSKNAGTTNVLRMGDKKLAAMVLAGDFFKGFIIVFLAKLVGVEDLALGTVAVFVVLGHLYPVFFGFRGGKGVATFIGALLGLSFILGAFTIVIWLVMCGIYRIASMASLAAAGTAPVVALLVTDPYYFLPIIGASILVLWKHRTNIDRLMAGKEPTITRAKNKPEENQDEKKEAPPADEKKEAPPADEKKK